MLEVVKVVRDLDHNFFLKKAYVSIDTMLYAIEEDTTVTELFKSNPRKSFQKVWTIDKPFLRLASAAAQLLITVTVSRLFRDCFV